MPHLSLAPAPAPLPTFYDLPFVQRTPLNFWEPERPSDDRAAYAEGREHALALLRLLRTLPADAPGFLLGRIVQDQGAWPRGTRRDASLDSCLRLGFYDVLEERLRGGAA